MRLLWLTASSVLSVAQLTAANPAVDTAVVGGAAETIGAGLVEVYDLQPESARLANISARGVVSAPWSAEREPMIGGFI